MTRGGASRAASAALAALALTGAAIATLAARPPPVETQTSRQDGSAAATEQIEAALQRLESGALDDAAEGVAGARGLIPAGDSCAMRRPKILPPLSRKARERLVAAHIAPSPDVKLRILRAVARDEPKSAWRALTHESEIARRTGVLEQARAAAEASRAIAPDPTCVADGHFLEALASDGFPRIEALRAAVALDPGFYNAWETLVIDLIERLDGVSGDCDADGATVIEAVVYLAKLARTDIQLLRLETLAGDGDGPARTLLMALVRERIGKNEDAARLYRAGRAAAGAACATQLNRVFDARLLALGEGRDER